MITLEGIRKRIYDSNEPQNYFGFDMSGEDTERNKEVLNRFKDSLDVNIILEDLIAHKGVIYYRGFDGWDFPCWETEQIIEWLIGFWAEHGKEIKKARAKKVSRIIKPKQRYAVLKRQGWKCNECAEVLKYNKRSGWEGEVAHIDHIHPFSKRETYPNGIENINEDCNLQALCPKCNKIKSNKEIQ